MKENKENQTVEIFSPEKTTTLKITAKKPPYIYLICTGLVLGISLNFQLMIFLLCVYAFFYTRILMDSTVFLPKIVQMTNTSFSDMTKKDILTKDRKSLIQLWKKSLHGTGMRMDVFLGIPIIFAIQIYVLSKNIVLAYDQNNSGITVVLVILTISLIISVFYSLLTMLKPIVKEQNAIISIEN